MKIENIRKEDYVIKHSKYVPVSFLQLSNEDRMMLKKYIFDNLDYRNTSTILKRRSDNVLMTYKNVIIVRPSDIKKIISKYINRYKKTKRCFYLFPIENLTRYFNIINDFEVKRIKKNNDKLILV